MNRTFLILVFIYLISFIGIIQVSIASTSPSNCDIDFSVPDDLHICESGEIDICGTINSAYDDFFWSVNGQEVNQDLCDEFFIDEESVLSLTVLYTNPNNLIENGDFESGNTGFTTDYLVGPGNCNHGAGFLGCEGFYNVMDDPSDSHSNFDACNDLVGGGNMMVVNGANGVVDIWCQNVCVEPDGLYLFSAWATSVNPGSPAELQFSIDGNLIGSIFNLSGTTCDWEQFQSEWQASGETSVEICVTNQNTAAGGNDFALDGIEFLQTCVEEKEFTVTVSDLEIEVVDPNILDCNSELVDVEIIVDSSDPYDIEWDTFDGEIEDISFGGEIITVSEEGTYMVTVTDVYGCDFFEEIFIEANNGIPSAGISADGMLLCDNPSVTVEAITDADDPSYQWEDEMGNQLGNTDQIEVTQGGVYAVTITDDETGCQGFAWIGVSEDTLTPNFNLELNNNLNCNFDSAVINTDSSFVSVQWSSNLLTPIAITNDTLEVTEPGIYIAEVVNQNGCSHRDTIEVQEIIPSFDYFLQGDALINCFNPIAEIFLDIDQNLFNVNWTNSNVTTPNNPRIEVNESGTYKVIITDSLGCTTMDSFIVEENFVVPNEIPTASMIACAQPVSTVAIQDPLNQYQVDWLHENGISYLGQDQFNTSTPGKVYYTITGLNGCEKTDSLEISSSLDFPEVSIQGDQLTCNKTEITLIANSNDVITDYNWLLPNGTTASGSEINVSESGLYSVVVTDDNDCEARTEFTVGIDTLAPNLQPIPEIILDCNQTTGTTSLNIFSPVEMIAWTGPNFSSDQFDITISEPGEYNVLVTGINGCESTETLNVSIDTIPPTFNISSPELLTCDDLSFSPVIDLPANYSAFIWSFPDGTTTDDTNIIINQAGVHNLEIAGANGCKTNTDYLVEENFNLPSFDIEASIITCSNPLSIITAVSASSNLEFTYFQNGNQIGTGESIEVNGDVSVVVTDTNGCSTEEFISPEIDTSTIDFSLDANIIDCNFPATNIIINAQDFNSAQLLDENGQFLSDITNGLQSEDIIESGIYQVQVFADNGCSSIEWIDIQEDTSTIQFGLDAGILDCNNTSTNITIDNQDFVLAQVFDENGLMINEITTGLATAEITESGIYEVQVYGSNGCVSNAFIEVEQDIELLDFDLSADTITCAIETAAILIENQTDFVDGSILHIDSNTSFDFAIEATVDLAGLYQVSLIGENGCTSNAEIEVLANIDNPETSTFDLELVGCNESAVISQINVEGGTAPYDIYLDNVILDNPTNSLDLESLGPHNLEVIDANGCRLDTNFTVSMVELVAADIIPEVTIQEGEELQLLLNINKPENEIAIIDWLPKEDLSCYDCLDPFYLGQDTTNYTISVTDINGCDAMVEVRINVIETTIISIYIPNIITPSIDNQEQEFTLYSGLNHIDQINLMHIYDRWGNLMFVNENFQPNLPNEGWNGRYNNQAVNPGVYVYYIEVLHLDGTTEIFADDLTVLR